MARRATGSHRRAGRGGGGAGWKKSKGLAIALACGIVVTWIVILVNAFSSGSTKVLYRDFPYTYATETSNKLVIRVADSNNQPKVPFVDEESGELCWEAYTCANPQCPARAKNPDQPVIFPYVVEYLKKVYNGEIDPNAPVAEGEMPPEMMYEQDMMACPHCKTVGLDPYMVERYQTEEGKKKIEELLEQYRKEKKDS